MLLKNNITRIFLEHPSGEFHLRKLAKLSGLSTTAVRNAAKELKAECIVREERKGIYAMFSANREDERYKDLKRFYNVSKIRDSGLISFLDEAFRHPEAVVLFGSVAKGEDIEESDIDIFILAQSREVDLEAYEKKIGKKVNLLVLDKAAFERAKRRNPELVNNLANGIVMKGYLKVL